MRNNGSYAFGALGADHAARAEPSPVAEETPMFGLTQSVSLSNYHLANFQGLILGCIEADFCKEILVGQLLTRSNHQIYVRPLGEMHLLNPIWKPRKALLRSVIWATINAPAKKQSNRSDAAGPGGKR